MNHTFRLLSFLVLFSAQSIAQSESATDLMLTVMNPTESGTFKTYEMMEIGVEIPARETMMVENFVKNASVKDDQKLNPYLDWELQVTGEFTHVQSGKKILLDAFYFQDFEAWGLKELPKPSKSHFDAKEYRSIGGYSRVKHVFPFRIRFAAPLEGDWNLRIIMKVRKKEIDLQSKLPVLVRGASQHNSYMSVDASKRTLQVDNRSFYPLGYNLPWPETDTLSDPELFNRLCYKENGIYYRSNEGYRFDYAAPRVYQRYRQSMIDLKKGGANYMRMIMYPSATDIEWEKIGNYTDRLPMARELDSILFLAEELGIYIHWNMQIHYSFQMSERAYYRTWTWNTQRNGEPFCYRAILGSDNPVDFFRDETAKMYYKQRLRYILSRWGYSTSVAMWELFSEISNVGSPKADNNEFYMSGDNWKVYSDWQKEMTAFIKSHYYGEQHIITCSFAGPKHPKDDVYAAPSIDLMSSNIYDFGAPDMAFFYRIPLGKHYMNEALRNGSEHSYMFDPGKAIKTYNTKPFIYSETDPEICGNSMVELKRMIWQIPFSGLAGGLSWHMRFEPELLSEYGKIDQFIKRIDLRNNNWHPCWATETEDGHWNYNYKYAEKMYVEKKGKADLTYLRSKNLKGAIGVITNTTVNPVSIGENCNLKEKALIIERYAATAENVNVKKEKIRVAGLKRGKYTISFYKPGESVAFRTITTRGKNLKLDVELGKTKNDFMVLFTINKYGKYRAHFI